MTGRARQNQDVARRFWRGMTEGDPGPILEFDPGVVWRVYGTGPNAGEYKGIDGVLRLLGGLAGRAEDMRMDLLDLLASDRAAALRLRCEFERGSKTLDEEFVVWLRIEGGTVVEVATVPFDQAAVDAFWKPH